MSPSDCVTHPHRPFSSVADLPSEASQPDCHGSEHILPSASEPLAPDIVIEDDRRASLERQGRRILAAKRASRSELSVSRGEWQRHRYAQTDVCSLAGITDTVTRVDSRRMSHQEFVQLYEKPGIPVVVTGLQDAWQAQKLWNKGELDQRFGNHKFKVGADDDGYAVRLKLKHFLGYLDDPVHQRDDSPMYIFDGTFGDRETSKDMLQDYSIPGWFEEDLMQLAGERRRPPYRLFKSSC